MGLNNSPLCRRCGAEDVASAHVSCECEALVTLRYTHLSSSFLDPEDIESLGLEAIWNFIKGTELPWFGHKFKGAQRACQKANVHRGQKGLNPLAILF